MSKKLALIIGNGQYQDSTLAQLKTPEADVNDLAELLRNPQIGGFDEATAVVNESESELRRRIARFFREKSHDDLLLLYFSGHGVLDDDGRLYLAARDTERDALSASAIPASYVAERMDQSRSKRQVLILDCCHSGAFARGGKGQLGTSVGTAAAFEGAGFGRFVLTATDSVQYAWEGDRVTGDSENSVFTSYLIKGLRTGEADLDADGQITLDELYDYVYKRVLTEKRRQTPCKWTYGQQGEIVIASNPSPIQPITLPPDLLHAIESPFATAREQALRELERLLNAKSKGLSLAARGALLRLIDDDSRKVSAAASAVLAKGGATVDQILAPSENAPEFTNASVQTGKQGSMPKAPELTTRRLLLAVAVASTGCGVSFVSLVAAVVFLGDGPIWGSVLLIAGLTLTGVLGLKVLSPLGSGMRALAFGFAWALSLFTFALFTNGLYSTFVLRDLLIMAALGAVFGSGIAWSMRRHLFISSKQVSLVALVWAIGWALTWGTAIFLFENTHSGAFANIRLWDYWGYMYVTKEFLRDRGSGILVWVFISAAILGISTAGILFSYLSRVSIPAAREAS
jgi:hypothetical protein